MHQLNSGLDSQLQMHNLLQETWQLMCIVSSGLLRTSAFITILPSSLTFTTTTSTCTTDCWQHHASGSDAVNTALGYSPSYLSELHSWYFSM